MSAAIMALASLDFLGMGVTAPAPSLGHLLAQGKANLDAWWIAVSAFGTLVITLLLLTFMGEALRNALDTHTVEEDTSTTAEENVDEVKPIIVSNPVSVPSSRDIEPKLEPA
jgi:microcin C transport system permease protein